MANQVMDWWLVGCVDERLVDLCNILTKVDHLFIQYDLSGQGCSNSRWHHQKRGKGSEVEAFQVPSCKQKSLEGSGALDFWPIWIWRVDSTYRTCSTLRTGSSVLIRRVATTVQQRTLHQHTVCSQSQSVDDPDPKIQTKDLENRCNTPAHVIPTPDML